MDWLQFDDDLQELLRRHEHQPDDSGLVEEICYGLNIRSHHNLCIEFARKGLAKRPEHPGLYYELIIASSLDTAHVLEDILVELQSILENAPDDQSVHRNLALARYFLEQDDQAEALLMGILEDHYTVERETFEVLAQVEYTRHNMEQCIYYCDKAIDRPGPSARVVRLKGLCYQEMDEMEKAKQCFLVALEQEPHFVWACHSLGGLYLVMEEFTQAFRLFGKATYINPEDPGNLFLVAEAFMDMDAHDLAAAELQKLLLCKPEKRIEAEVHNALGYIAIRRREWDKAKDHLSTAVELEPELAVAYYNMGSISQAEGSIALAEYHFKLALDFDPAYVDAWVELGFLLMDRKAFDEAEPCFKAALDIEPFSSSAYIGLAKLSQKKRNYQEQLRYAQAGFGYDPENSEVCNHLGIAQECNKAYLDAEEAYVRALQLEPLHAQAANNLGYLYEKMMTVYPDREAHYQDKAVAAWTRRLQICSQLKRSIRGATTHLRKLGLSQERIDHLATIPPETGGD